MPRKAKAATDQAKPTRAWRDEPSKRTHKTHEQKTEARIDTWAMLKRHWRNLGSVDQLRKEYETEVKP